MIVHTFKARMLLAKLAAVSELLLILELKSLGRTPQGGAKEGTVEATATLTEAASCGSIFIWSDLKNMKYSEEHSVLLRGRSQTTFTDF